VSGASDPFDLQRFVDAQQGVFATALSELQSGSKRSHWMWFVFPQIAGLGHSAMSRHFAIRSRDEARAYLAHPVLGSSLRESIKVLLQWAGERDSESIFGPVDSMKLRSSLTLFAEAAPDESLFCRALDAFFSLPDPETLRILAE
jgi:uncharacterized protein (DUF1810 family)